MEPKSLSASGLQTYMECPARFKVEYIDRVRISSGGGSAGDLGSLLHACLEWWVKEGMVNGPDALPLINKCKELAPNYGVDALQIKVATKMLVAWLDRWESDDVEFEVLQAEIKEAFDLRVQTSDGSIYETKVTYIWDRVDKLLEDGSIRVVDYKSWMKFLTADEIFHYLQVRLYALAAAIKYKDQNPPYIWVALDQLRYGQPTAVRFTREDIRDIWAWLKATYLNILNDDGTTEIVGNGCRWCVRSTSCTSFNNAVAAGTVVSYRSPEDAARRVAEINAVTGALNDTKAALLSYLETYLEERGYLEERFQDAGVTLKITPKRNRTVNQEDAMAAIGPELAAQYGKLGVTVIDELLDGDLLSEEQKSALRKSVSEGVSTSTNAVFK
jgi:PD-(D/E)XK nuclease superfamily